MVGAVGKCQQIHAGLIGKAIALARVTSLAGGNHIGPRIFTTSRQGYDMVSAQGDIVEVIAAVQAHVLISSKQSAIGKGRFLTLIPIHLTLEGYNAVERPNCSFTGDPVRAPAYP